MTPPAIRDDQTLKPIVAAILGVFSFSVLDAFLKSVSVVLPTVEVVFLRFVFGSVVATVALLWSGRRWPGRETLVATFIRACITVVAVFGFVYAVSVLPLATAVVLTYSAPVFMALFAWLLLGEPVTRRAITAIGLGFVGILITLGGRLALPDNGALIGGALSALLSGASYALSMILARKRSTRDDIEFTVWGQNAFSAVIVLPFAIFGWQGFDLPVAASFVAIGFAAVVAQFLLVWAFANAVATRVAPIEFSSLLWAGLFGFLFFQERPGIETILGALLIAASGIIVASRQAVPIENG